MPPGGATREDPVPIDPPPADHAAAPRLVLGELTPRRPLFERIRTMHCARHSFLSVLGAMAAFVLLAWMSATACAQGNQPQPSEPYLFHNYYVAPNPAGGVGAGLYPSPRSTIPPHVGHTYITYQALAPHEMMYPHRRSYYRYHPGGGWTKAKVWWAW